MSSRIITSTQETPGSSNKVCPTTKKRLFFASWHSTSDTKRWSLWADWLITAGAYTGFCSMKRLGVFVFPLDGIVDHRSSLPRKFLDSPTIRRYPFILWVERGTVRVKCLAQENNTVSLARVRFHLGQRIHKWEEIAPSRIGASNSKLK